MITPFFVLIKEKRLFLRKNPYIISEEERHRDILQGKVSQGKFTNLNSWSPGAGFFPIRTIN